MQIRTSKPGSGNKFFITTGSGGYSRCIVGKPTDSQCNVLANCVGYACGRFNEIIGSMKYPNLNCNAENFIERAKNTYGLQVVPYPTLGGIMVWQKGATLDDNDGAGHVGIVERIDSANQIYTSESGYSGPAFWNSIRSNNNGRWGLGSGYTFRGCIVNPAIGDVHYTEPVAPTKTIDEIAKEVINGDWGNGKDRKDRLTKAGYDYSAVQNRVNEILAPKPTPAPVYKTYTVQRGDNLSKIAGKFGTTWQKIYEDNKELIDNTARSRGVNIKFYNYIYAGQVLIIK